MEVLEGHTMSKAFDSLEPGFKEQIGELCTKLGVMGIVCAVTAGRRTIAEQDKLYAQGRTAAGPIVTRAKGGQSPHNFGLAADLCPVHNVTKDLWWNAPDDVWKVIADTAQEMGLVAGYYFKSIHDAPHIEHPAWKEMQAAWQRGEINVA